MIDAGFDITVDEWRKENREQRKMLRSISHKVRDVFYLKSSIMKYSLFTHYIIKHRIASIQAAMHSDPVLFPCKK